MVLCVACTRPEISKLSDGTFYEPKADLIKKRKSARKVEGRLCGSCTQIFLNKKQPKIPWDGVIETKTKNDNLSRRRRRPRRRRRRS